MSLLLDTRARDMLAEMGVRVFTPEISHSTAPALPAAASVPTPKAAAGLMAPLALRRDDPAPGDRETQAAPPLLRGLESATDAMDWTALEAAVAALGEGRTVLGTGARRADLMVVGDPPGEDELQQGEPFVGAAGTLLDNMLRALGLDRRRTVYLTNVLKHRPAGNRNPETGELAQGEQFLRRQVALVQPRVILAMGRFAVQALLGTQEPIGRLRGRVHDYNGVAVVVTLHPAYLQRNLLDKSKAWADLCLAQSLLRR